MPDGQVTVTGCPCGQDHHLSPASYAVFCSATAGKPPGIPVTVADVGSWVVPRLYIALHGIKGGELATLAERYGWPEPPGGT